MGKLKLDTLLLLLLLQNAGSSESGGDGNGVGVGDSLNAGGGSLWSLPSRALRLRVVMWRHSTKDDGQAGIDQGGVDGQNLDGVLLSSG